MSTGDDPAARAARVVMWNGVAAVELRAGTTRAVVVPQLGMLTASFVVDGFDFVARPGGLGAYRRGHTTAVPLLYPWANRLARREYTAAGRTVSLRGLALHTDERNLPIHGTMTARPEWDDVVVGPGRVRATFDFGAHPDLLRAFPFPHHLTVAVAIGARRIRVTTTVTATGGVAVPVAFGWHPYWRAPGPRDAWTLALPAVRHATLDRRGLPTGAVRAEPATTVALAGREFDDLYALDRERSVTLTGGGRRLRVDSDAGYPWRQVFAPAGRAFCCIEPMTAPTNALITGDHPQVAAAAAWSAAFGATVR